MRSFAKSFLWLLAKESINNTEHESNSNCDSMVTWSLTTVCWHPPTISRALAFDDDVEYNLDQSWSRFILDYSAQDNTRTWCRPGTHRCWGTNPRGTQCCTAIGAGRPFEKVSGTSSGTGEINSNCLRVREKQKSLSGSLPYLMSPSPPSNVHPSIALHAIQSNARDPS